MKFLSNLVITVLLSVFGSTFAFAPVSFVRQPHHAPHVAGTIHTSSTTTTVNKALYQPPALLRQRKSVATVQTMGLFGLGAPEIAIILVAAAFLLGPQKLAELGKDAGKIAGELKEVPKEFQKGLEEGESQARAMKAKNMSEVEDAEKE